MFVAYSELMIVPSSYILFVTDSLIGLGLTTTSGSFVCEEVKLKVLPVGGGTERGYKWTGGGV